ncbi:D-alanyl-D-alanine carboxypeptidase DacA [Roseibaca ekhonensis]|uniref:serine-type D-Ala-D-Ala carboxypeptidase n=1 Tax=Roseinatronobacter ekhonensis TaxID=254356 RepID=A0A3B0MUW8_9RHOB|nr:D-alanyl-D-alanine carboxypeptidase family protein [Roseibaca ekhonensis]SUZ31626.1 D-alanyl-D-alanine carboxypeptidase DacA [Roseibaca ekhonensis]
MIRPFAKSALIAAIFLAFGASAHAQDGPGGFSTRATSAYVVDLGTGTVLLSKNADEPLPPASMSKLMTLEMLFEAIKEGRVALDTPFSVSQRAYQMGGSRMFLEMRDRPTAEELIRGIAILSGNDAAVVVAEGLAGTEDAYARLATQRARELGMDNTTITNASGWPDANHLMSKRDLVTLASYMLREHPEFYHYFAERSFTWNGIEQDNRVPLLDAGIGLDGLKTGFTSAAGYSLTGSARQGNRRIVFAYGGLDSPAARVQEAESIVNWAFRQFAEVTVAEAGSVLAQAPVWLGEAASIPLVVAEDAQALVPAIGASTLDARVEYDAPLPAPIAQGDVLGKLVVELPEMDAISFDLVAGADVAEGGFMVRAQAAALRLIALARGEVEDETETALN